MRCRTAATASLDQLGTPAAFDRAVRLNNAGPSTALERAARRGKPYLQVSCTHETIRGSQKNYDAYPARPEVRIQQLGRRMHIGKLPLSSTMLAMAVGFGSALPAHADYFRCVDRTGTVYNVRQALGSKYMGFFSSCKAVIELDKAAEEPEAEQPGSVSQHFQGAVVELPAEAHEQPGLTRNARVQDSGRRIAFKPGSRAALYVQVEPYIHQIASEYRLDPLLLTAIIRVESGFNTRAVSPKGALGLMQVMPATGERYGIAKKQLLDPMTNIRTGAKYLVDLAGMFGNRIDLVLAGYNAGEGAVRQHQNRIPPYPETVDYVDSVLRYYRSYRSASY